MEWRYDHSASSRETVTKSPSESMQVSSMQTSRNSPPYAPAFMMAAPPMVPGMPAANSKPDRPACRAACATSLLVAPAWARMIFPSMVISDRLPRTCTTTPRTPESATRRSLPLPRIRMGVRVSEHTRWIRARSSILCGMAYTSAGPPMANVVCLHRGSPSKTLSRPSTFSRAGTNACCLSSDQETMPLLSSNTCPAIAPEPLLPC